MKTINYKGYTIEKPKQDTYMRLNNIRYLAYDISGNLFDGDATLEGIKQKIDAKETQGND